MNDAPRRPRLDRAIGVEERSFVINGFAFFGTGAAARRLRDAGDRGRGAKPPQAVLAFDAATVLDAAGARGVRLCAFSNGFLDRSAPGPGRRPHRRRDDHRPLEHWREGDRPAEIAVAHGLPPEINFELIN